jgi:hypothetical protein
MIGISENAVLAFCAALSTDIVTVDVMRCDARATAGCMRCPRSSLWVNKWATVFDHTYTVLISSSSSTRWQAMPTGRASI